MEIMEVAVILVRHIFKGESLKILTPLETIGENAFSLEGFEKMLFFKLTFQGRIQEFVKGGLQFFAF